MSGLCAFSHMDFSLLSSGKLTNSLQAMCNVCANSVGMLLLTTLHMGHISKISFPDPFYLLPQISNPRCRFLFTHTVPASRVPKRLMVTKCCKKKLESSEEHPRGWSRSHNCWAGCPCSLLPHPDLSAKLCVHWDNAGACRYFPTCLHSSSSSADAVLSVHIHKCCDLFDEQIGTFMHLLQAGNLRPGMYLQMHLCN